MNKLKLSLENFQSISSGELEFQTGLNFIIGQSNSGKSATFRALKACLVNPPGSQRYIKRDTKKSSVTLEYNGNTIVWQRTPKESSYTINGEDYVKTGKSNAMKILGKDTGFVQDCNDTLMNIEEELQLPFPFGMSESDLFKLYEDVFCVSDSAVILKAAKERENEESLNIFSTENEITKTTRKLEELDKFKEEVDLSKLEKCLKLLKSKKNKIDSLEEGMDVVKLAVALDKEDFSFPEINWENYTDRLKENVELEKVIKRTKKLHSLGKEVSTLTLPEAVDVQKYKDLIEYKKALELSCIEFPEIDIRDRLTEYEELRKYLNTLNEIKASIKSRSAKVNELNKYIGEIEEQLKEVKVCPLCHSVLTEEHEC